jgi:hypothetical protein
MAVHALLTPAAEDGSGIEPLLSESLLSQSLLSESLIRVTLIRVPSPSPLSESLIRVPYPSPLSESLIRAAFIRVPYSSPLSEPSSPTLSVTLIRVTDGDRNAELSNAK